MRKISCWGPLFIVYAFLVLGCHGPKIEQFLFNPYVVLGLFIIILTEEDESLK